MAEPTLVNGQITDSVTQAHHLSVGSAPGFAVASSLLAMAHAAGLNMLNASHDYQQWAILNQAATAQAANEVLLAGIDVFEPPETSAEATKLGRKGG